MALLWYHAYKEVEEWLCCLQKGGKTTGGDVLVSDHIPKVKVGISTCAEACQHVLPDRRNASTCMRHCKGPMTIYQLVQACMIVSVVQFSESFWFPSK